MLLVFSKSHPSGFGPVQVLALGIIRSDLESGAETCEDLAGPGRNPSCLVGEKNSARDQTRER